MNFTYLQVALSLPNTIVLLFLPFLRVKQHKVILNAYIESVPTDCSFNNAYMKLSAIQLPVMAH